MFKCPLQTADNFKAKAGPKFHGAFVCADDKLNCMARSRVFGALQRVKDIAERCSALRCRPSDVTAIGDVHASPAVGLSRNKAGTVPLFPDKCFFFPEKTSIRVLSLLMSRGSVYGIAADHRLENYQIASWSASVLRVEWPREKLTSTDKFFKTSFVQNRNAKFFCLVVFRAGVVPTTT